MAHAGGRPAKYEGKRTVDAALAYLAECVDSFVQVPVLNSTGDQAFDEYDSGNVKYHAKTVKRVRLPSVAGLAIELKVARSTVYLWAKEYPEFSDILETILATQEQVTLEGGLSGEYSAVIAKLVLGKHGYRDEHGLTDPAAMAKLTDEERSKIDVLLGAGR